MFIVYKQLYRLWCTLNSRDNVS